MLPDFPKKSRGKGHLRGHWGTEESARPRSDRPYKNGMLPVCPVRVERERDRYRYSFVL